MNDFTEMLRKITSSPYHNQMMQFTASLDDCFGINHFWYYRITNSGDYSYLGTHIKWSEFCLNQSMIDNFSCLRHPSALQPGISLMKVGADSDYQKVLNSAWDQFRINFNINLIKKIPEGVEAFGFASRFNDPKADERLLNHLPMLNQFIKTFRSKHRKMFELLEDNQVNLPDHFGSKFYERPKELSFPIDQNQFLRKMGFELIFNLTPREIDVLKLISSGYTAAFMANQLRLSKRTVENYIDNIKGKLCSHSKIDLIHKAQEILATGFFD